MAESVKVLQTGAFQMEAGQAGAGQSPGWGQSGSEETLGTNNAFPYLELGKGKTINYEKDNSVTTNAFEDLPRKVTDYVEKSLSMNARVADIDQFMYWAFGFELPVVTVGVFVLTAPSVEPVAGATYRDTDLNDFTFMRKEVNRTTTYYIFRCDDSHVPTLATGNLTKQAGTGGATLAFTAHSVLMYEHTFELDSRERHFTSFCYPEQIAGYSAGDKKNRMATIGIKMGTNDYRYKNSMCKKFNFKSSAAQFAQMAFDFVAHSEDRGDYSSSSWTYPAGLTASANIITHAQLRVELGTAEGSLTAVGATDVEVGFDAPLKLEQDTNSGVYLAEPQMEGKYGLTCNIVLSRYAAETWQGYRDNWTTVIGRISAEYGYYRTEFLVNSATLPEAGPDDSEIAKENLSLVVGYSATNNWSSWLYGNTLVHKSPLIMRVRNLSSTNQMFAI
jgi:hypothetical protein